MKPFAHCGALLLVLVMALIQPLYAATFKVTTSEELQAALASASENGSEDQILIEPGLYLGNFRYRGNGPEQLLIEGIPDSSGRVPTLDGDKVAYVLWFDSGQFESDLTIKNLEIRNGLSKFEGGGLRVDGFFDAEVGHRGKLNIENVKFKNNRSSSDEGSIFGSSLASVEISNSEFSKNTSEYWNSIFLLDEGGLAEGPFTIESTSFVGDGSICCGFEVRNSEFFIVSGTIFRSVAFPVYSKVFDSKFIQQRPPAGLPGGDGAIGQLARFEGNRLSDFSTSGCLVRSPFVIGNEIKMLRGGTIVCSAQEVIGNSLSLEDGSYVVENAQVVANNQIIGGRSAAILGAGDDNIKNTVWGNSIVTQEGVGIELRRASDGRVLNNSVFSGSNHAFKLSPQSGASIFVQNNIFMNNGGVDAIYLDRDAELYGDGFDLEATRNIVRDDSVPEFSQGNLVGDPSFFDVEENDLHVTVDSIAINAGDSDALLVGMDFDLDGNPRILEGIVDIGAYERATTALHPADTNGDNAISQEEFDAYNLAWRGNDKWTSSTEVIPVDFVTRAGYLLQNGGAYKNIGVGKPRTWVPLND